MLKIIAPFLRESARIQGYALAAGVAITVVAKVFGLKDVAGIAFALPVIGLLLVMPLLAGNLNWMVSLPITKSRLMLAGFLLNVLSALIGIVIFFSLLFLHFFVFSESYKNATKSAARASLWKLLTGVWSSFTLGEIAFWLFVVLFIPCLFFPHKARFGAANSPHVNMARQRVKSMLWVLALVFGFPVLVSLGVFNPIGISAFGFVALPFLLMRNSMRAVGFARPGRRAWLGGMLALSVAATLLLYFTAQSRLNYGDSASSRYEASNFLGSFSGRLDRRAALEEFLKDDLSSSDLYSAVHSYSMLMHGGRENYENYWLNQNESTLKFQDLVRNKKDSSAVNVVASMFDPRFLTRADFEALMKMEESGLPVGKSYSQGLSPAYWVYLDFTPREVIEMIESTQAAKVNIGLTYARFHPRPEYREVILRLLKNGATDERLNALLYTLSIFSEATNSMVGYAKLVNEKSPPAYVSADCDKFIFAVSSNDTSKNGELCKRQKSLKMDFRTVLQSDGQPYFNNRRGFGRF